MTFDVLCFTDMSVQTDNKDVLCELIIYLTIKMLLLYYTSLVEILCALEEKISLICWQLLHDVYAMEILLFDLAMNFLNFLSNWGVLLVGRS